jgi:hypothetical protein
MNDYAYVVVIGILFAVALIAVILALSNFTALMSAAFVVIKMTILFGIASTCMGVAGIMVMYWASGEEETLCA